MPNRQKTQQTVPSSSPSLKPYNYYYKLSTAPPLPPTSKTTFPHRFLYYFKPKSMAPSDDVKVLGAPPSPFVNRVQIAVNLTSVDYKFLEQKVGFKSELLLKSNPVHKKVPVMIHGGKPICESLIIVQYIDEVWTDGTGILPLDLYDRAMARFWHGLLMLMTRYVFWLDFFNLSFYWSGKQELRVHTSYWKICGQLNSSMLEAVVSFFSRTLTNGRSINFGALKFTTR